MSAPVAEAPVEHACYTQADLIARWRLEGEGRALLEKLRRMCDKLKLRPFYGKGEAARYRPADVLRAEERRASR